MNDGRLQVLVLEDDPNDARIAIRALSKAGGGRFAFEHVTRLADALMRLSATRYDAALVDLSVPDSGGLETVNRVLAAAPRLPVVVLSGQDDEEVALAAVQAGAQDFVVKDQMVPEVLVRSIEYAIQRDALMRELREKTDELERSHASIRERDLQFRTVARCVPGVVYLAEHDSLRRMRFLNVAVEGLTGVRAEEFLQGTISWLDIVHPEDRARVVARIDSALAQREPFAVEYRIVDGGGEWAWVEERGAALFDSEGSVKCVAGTVFDVTARHETEEAIDAFRGGRTGRRSRGGRTRT